MKKWMKAGLIAAGMTMLPATPAIAISFGGKIPVPPQPPSVCSLPSVLSLFCSLGL